MRRMPTTRWTIFWRARSQDPETAKRAVAELCEHYVDAIYGHFLDRGEPRERAEDLAQGLIVELIATDAFARIDPDKGSARSYLCKAADHYAKDRRKARTADKRGGGVPDVVLDTTDAAERYSPADEGMSPEDAWDLRWAHGVLERVFARIRADLAKPKPGDEAKDTAARLARWTWLEPLLRENTPPGRYAELAELTGKREGALRGWVSRMRKRAERYIHQELADQVDLSNPDTAQANVDAERERLRGAGLRVGEDEESADA